MGQDLANISVVMKLELTAREIADLAEFAGFTINREDMAEDELETPYTVTDCPTSGVTDETADDGPRHYSHIAYSSEYPDEGVHPLGDELSAPTKKGWGSIKIGGKILDDEFRPAIRGGVKATQRKKQNR